MTINNDKPTISKKENVVVISKMETPNLTEKWRNGELEQGWYYANNDGERIIIYIFEKNGSILGDDFDLKATDWIKPIAPVPSWEQWQQMKAFCEEFNALDVAEENQRLKSLLKECKKTFFEIRLSLSSGKINSVFDLSYQRENDINEALK